MNAEQLKAAINFDYQLSTFAINMHQYFMQVSPVGAELSADLIAFSEKLGDFVHTARKAGFSVTEPAPIVS
jgi:hypothetical protein